MVGGRTLRVAVVGAGAAGIAMLIKLKEIGVEDIALFEKAPDLGGTWHYNRYPGLACDVPSLAYRYSFAPNAEWTHVCASGPQIQTYLRDVANAFDVTRYIRFDSEVVETHYEDGRWRLTTVKGDQGVFDVVVTAVGVLHHAKLPDIPGLETFAGPAMHTSAWDDSVLLDGKRVGVIGTGSTATQLTAALVGRVAHLSLFQRTAQWILRLINAPIPEEQREAYRANPALLDEMFEKMNNPDPSRPDFSSAVVGEDPASMAELQRLCQEYLDTSVKDPALRAKLTPTYPAGCKRLIQNHGFYEAIQQPNAELVTEGIERIEPKGIRTRDGRLHELDVLALATGFDTHRLVRPMKVTGVGGLTLDEAWAEGNKGYKCVSVPGFPNWFMIGGPQSPIGNFSWITTIESEVGYIAELIKLLRAGEARAIAPKQDAADAFNEAVKARLPKTIWAQGCTNWYTDKFGNVACWPWTLQDFKAEMKHPNLDHFELDVREPVDA